MIETERLILRPWQESDASALYKYAKDPKVGPIAGWSPHTSVENSREIIRTVFNAPHIYAVVVKETGEPIGCCGIMIYNSRQSTSKKISEGEIGYWIGKPYWGEGLIPEAVRALLFHSFNVLHLDIVWCGFYDGNNQSKRVCEKCGLYYHHTNYNVTSPLGDLRTEHFFRITKADFNYYHEGV